ncbi:hypothetical protein F4679DRAFT_582891 [Xylaria curta]|nr:hypothetical protein F4679DRAFT_582891 [Xylaria curta]
MEDMDVPCGHGCCSQCSRHPSSRGSSPEISFAEVRKSRAARKGHSRSLGFKRPSAYDPETATSSLAAYSSQGSRKSTFDINVDYLTKKTKTPSSSKKKGCKHRSQY